jgi:Flp pilus assembly protein TadG
VITTLRTRLDRLCRRGREAGVGGESLELIILAPLILALFMVIVAVGRHELGSGKIDQAAGAAARAASQQVSAVQAEPAAVAAAQTSLASAGITCQDITVAVDNTGFTAPAGSTAAVSVTVSCTVSWSDLTIPGWPGSKDIQASAASPLDTRRVGT